MFYNKFELHGKSRREKRKIAKWYINSMRRSIKIIQMWEPTMGTQMYIEEYREWISEWENALRKM